jgi:hypothetical protein
MSIQELMYQYEINKTTIQHNDNGDWDFDISPLEIKFEIDETSFAGSRTKKIEDNTINLLQDVFTQQGWELKNATNGIKNNYGTLLVEHHQHKRIENELIPSGILVSKSGYWFFGIDDVGFIVLKKEFLNWCYEFNCKTKMMKDSPIESQKGGNEGYAFLISYELLPHLISKYRQELNK